MYVFGFREGWLWIFPTHEPLVVDLSVFAAMFAIANVSAAFALHTQFLVMGATVHSLIIGFAVPPRVPLHEPRAGGRSRQSLSAASLDSGRPSQSSSPRLRASSRGPTCRGIWQIPDERFLAGRVARLPRDSARIWKPDLLVPVSDPFELGQNLRLLTDACRPDETVRVVLLGSTDDEERGLIVRDAGIANALA